jgi:hypothetical protein
VEGIWSVLKDGVLANLAIASFGHLIQVIRHGLKKIQYQPGLIEGCLAGTGLALEPAEPQRTSRIKGLSAPTCERLRPYRRPNCPSRSVRETSRALPARDGARPAVRRQVAHPRS